MNLIFCSKDLLQLIPNYDNSVFMVYFKLARVRHNVLMRQKISDIVMDRVSWVG